MQKGDSRVQKWRQKKQMSLEYKNIMIHEVNYLIAHITDTEMQKKVGEIILPCTK